jgi:hypothetical protein
MLVMLALLAPVFNWPGLRIQPARISVGLPRTATYTSAVLALTSVLAVAATLYCLPANSPKPYRPGPRIVRAGIWTVCGRHDDCEHCF